MTRKAGSIPAETKTSLLESATMEFAELGFQKSSLRSICARANVTTGALYFFFQDKEDLFRSVLSPVTDRILILMEGHYKAERSNTFQNIVADESEDLRIAKEFLEIYYANQTVCRIIISNREHPLVSGFFDRLTKMMERQSEEMLAEVPPSMLPEHVFNECTIHWFSHLQIDAVLHIIAHGFSEERAKEQLNIMIRFLRGGFFSLLS